MIEHAVRLSTDHGLIGVVTGAEPGAPERPSCVWLNAGMLHRIGPNRLYVRLARALARHGVTSLRFDLSGVGDRAPRRDGGTFRAAAVRDVTDAMDHLAAAHEARGGFILGRVCSGADLAFRVALGDSRVAGLVLIDGLPYRTRRAVVHAAVRRVVRQGAWRKVVAPARVLRALRGVAVPAPVAAPAAGLGQRDVPSQSEAEQFIAGRSKEIINRAGETIAPREVDEVLLRHPGVAEAVTCAVPDARLGEDVVAVVVRHPGVELTEHALREFASRHLATSKVPRRIFFRPDIPKGATGKIQRVGLARALGLDPASPAPARPPGGEALATPREIALAEIWREVLETRDVGRHDNFFELGGDSLAAMEVVAAIEARLGAILTVRDLAFGTLQQLAAGGQERAATAAPGIGARRHEACSVS